MESSFQKPKVTAVLITWKRQKNIPMIVDNLLQYEFIDQIIIRDNSKAKNIINYGRYCQKTKNVYIYTQDDDCIVHNIRGIYDSFVRDSTRISFSGEYGYEDKIPDNIFGKKQMVMAGWGYMFNRRWINVLNKYIDKYGKDECFYRETDRIFSILLNKHHNFVEGGVIHLEGKNNEFALCNQPEHLDFKKLAIKRALSL